MERKKQEEFYKKYPKLFRQKDLSIQESCMPWGINFGEGWSKILDILCSDLQWDTDRNGYPQIEFTQLKEKFGGMRAYYTFATDNTYKHKIFRWKGLRRIFNRYSYCISSFSHTGILRLGCFDLELVDVNRIRQYGDQEGKIGIIELLSNEVCEDCGSMGDDVYQTKGWISTICPECFSLRQKEREKDIKETKKYIKSIKDKKK